MIKPPLETELSNEMMNFARTTISEVTVEVDPASNLEKRNKQTLNEIKQATTVQLSNNAITYNHKGRHDDKSLVHKCEYLKICFLTVRKVSDHILVKWQVPKTLKNVLGYELSVDGRTVQKIEENLCCESVISDIPHTGNIPTTVGQDNDDHTMFL